MRAGILALVFLGCVASFGARAQNAALPGKVETIATGAKISGANGISFGPDGLLYVTSVVGSEMLAMDPETGAVKKRWTPAEGVTGPDDVAFAPDGSYFWTSIMTGEVAGFRPDGKRIVAGKVTPGVNPLTFSDDGRLFVAECFFDDKLYEMDPAGVKPPRLIRGDLGPRCGLNGMDWGPDDRLYGPRWFLGEIVSLDVDTGEMVTVAKGFKTPAAVKFDSQGRLHVLDTMAGDVIRVEGEKRTVVAHLEPGLDNFAFDKNDRLFVSSFADGFVVRVEPDGSLKYLSPGGMAHPGGVAAHGGEVFVADLHAVRYFDAATGKETRAQRNIVGMGPIGTTISLAADGPNVILCSWLDDDVRVWDPKAEKTLERYTDQGQPVSAIRFGSGIAVAQHKKQRVVLVGKGEPTVIAEKIEAPTGLALLDGDLYLTERKAGQVLRLTRAGKPLAAPEVIAKGLTAPEGIAPFAGGLAVVESTAGRVVYVGLDGKVTPIAAVPVSGGAGSDAQPPSFIFNGIAAGSDGALYVADERERALLRITLPKGWKPGA
jgi:sugar lactone lactonase YvrE